MSEELLETNSSSGVINATVRYAATLLLAFAFINVARETTYLIGGIQHYGAPQMHHYKGVFHSLFSLVLGGMAKGLKNQSRRAWWTTILGGTFISYQIWTEFYAFAKYKARGYTEGDVQLVLLGCALMMLVGAVVLLLSPQGRAPFFRNEFTH